jgi:hypothetical protein
MKRMNSDVIWYEIEKMTKWCIVSTINYPFIFSLLKKAKFLKPFKNCTFNEWINLKKLCRSIWYCFISQNVFLGILTFQNDWLIDWLIIHCFTSRLRIFHLYGEVTITGEGIQNLGLCSALRAFEQEEIFMYHTCCDTGPRFFQSHLKDCPIQSALTTHKGMWKIYSKPDPHGNISKWSEIHLLCLLNYIMFIFYCS